MVPMKAPNIKKSPRNVRMGLVVCLTSGFICPTAAQRLAPFHSCTNNLLSFAGIVCSGNAITGKVMHCLLNENFQAVLVCSKWKLIPAGRCPSYSEQYSGIDEFDCIGNALCPREPFKSYEVYKHPACLNSSLYITEPTTTQADITEQPSSCTNCEDGGSTGSTTGTETTTKSTLPTDSKCDVVSESSKQSVSCTVPVTIAVIFGILVTLVSCLLMVWEYRREKILLGMIFETLRKRCHDRVAKKDVQKSHEGADVPIIEPAAIEADMVETLRKRCHDRVAKKDVQESHEGADVLMIEADMRGLLKIQKCVHPRNGSCHYSAADSPQGSQGGAAVQEGKAQGSPRLVDNFEEI